MSDTRNPRERLDALLCGLEDEVMHDEGVVATDIGSMRSEIERLIDEHLETPNVAQLTDGEMGSVEQRAPGVMALLSRWARLGRSGRRGRAPLRARMAFSAEREGSGDSRARAPGSTLDRATRENDRRNE